ncbi:hypothetical protein A8L34_25715 [Bacillus sp. FJAT-27264]|uniref:DUF1129 family protein n=1 Tax=Paenibacillus sp. (strain DSM 101736 / FJAT-27264) TaxID=1850362 RepID=UPI000807CE9B|nr:DUF1129 family protein [Bacillus sp. FJAT-27264]OBZ07535.1 hypothetical protein A8L34_25715 [Bacillus sp. FJAT-27264]
MKVKDMIKENNALREQLTPFNRSYFEDMILAMRASRVDTLRTEELLLEAAKLLVQEQGKGKNAKQIFGEHPEDYFREIVESVPPAPTRSKLSYYLMIPWAALTCLFGVLGAFGLLFQWTTGSSGIFSQVSLFTLVAVGIGSIVVIELFMKWMAALSDSDTPQTKGFDLKGLSIYITIAAVVIFVGTYLDTLLPVFSISPWISLIIFAVGAIGLKVLFLKK